MEQNKVNTFAAKFKKAFSEAVLNELGKATRYCHRVRQLTPYRMVMTLIALFAGTRVESLADLQRGFNALFGYAMDYKPFYDQLAKREFATFMRETARRFSRPCDPCARRGAGERLLGVSPHRYPDGSSFAIKNALKEVFPTVQEGEARGGRTACDFGPLYERFQSDLTADTASERAALPKGLESRGCLLMADRGYSTGTISVTTKAGASFVIRAQKLESQGAGGL